MGNTGAAKPRGRRRNSCPSFEPEAVTWPPGDPSGVRRDWAQRAGRHATRLKRQRVARLVNAIWPYLNATEGRAWPSNAALAADLGCLEKSVEEAIADAERLGVLIRETRTKKSSAGFVIGRERRIIPALPRRVDLDRRPPNPVRSKTVSPNPVSEHKSAVKTAGSMPNHDYPDGVRSPNPVRGDISYANSGICQSRNDVSGAEMFHRTPDRTPCGTGYILDSETSRDYGLGTACTPERVPAPARTRVTAQIPIQAREREPEVARLLDAIASICPGICREGDGTYGQMLRPGRMAWKLIGAHGISSEDSEAIVAALEEAAERTWTGHDGDIARMLGKLRERAGVVAA